MSHVIVLAADKELPLQDCQKPHTTEYRGFSVTCQGGFKVEELVYYRQAVEDLGYPIKGPFRYELSLEADGETLRNLRAYLEENFSQGETAELWSVWVGDFGKKCPPCFRGRLEEFDMDALEQFLSAEENCFRITM